LLGGAARTRGLSRLVTDLVTHPAGQEFYRMRVPTELVGETLAAALSRIKSEYEALLIGFVNVERDGFDLNPSSTRVLAADDVLLVISSNADALAAHAVG
jgi:Trk K+ transport system NAD-binding subunit